LANSPAFRRGKELNIIIIFFLHHGKTDNESIYEVHKSQAISAMPLAIICKVFKK